MNNRITKLSKTFPMKLMAVLMLCMTAGAAWGLSLNVMDYGANGSDTNNDYTAFKTAIDAIASAGGAGELYVPAGVYYLDTLLQKAGGTWDLTLRGAGPGQTVIYSGRTSATGFIKFSNLSSTSQVTVMDLKIIPLRSLAGTAISIGGNPSTRINSLVVRDVVIGDNDTSGVSFNIGVYAARQKQPVFDNFYFTPTTNNSDYALNLDSCEDVLVQNSRMIYGHTNVYITNPLGTSGLTVISSQMPQGKMGIYFDNTGKTGCSPVISGSHVSVDSCSIKFKECAGFLVDDFFTLHGGDFKEDLGNVYCDISVESCDSGLISSSIFGYPAADLRTMLYADSTSTNVMIANSIYQSPQVQLDGSPGDITETNCLVGKWGEIARWEMNNTTDDRIGKRYPLDLIGSPVFSTVSKEGSHSLSLNGSGQYAKLDYDVFKSPFQERVISLWIKADSPNSGIQNLYEEGGSANGVALRLNNGVLEGAISSGGVVTKTSATYTGGTSWTQVMLTYDGSRSYELQLYINGVLAAFKATGVSEIGTHNNVTAIGACYGTDAFGTGATGNYFAGKIDNVRVLINPNDLVQELYTDDNF